VAPTVAGSIPVSHPNLEFSSVVPVSSVVICFSRLTATTFVGVVHFADFP